MYLNPRRFTVFLTVGFSVLRNFKYIVLVICIVSVVWSVSFHGCFYGF